MKKNILFHISVLLLSFVVTLKGQVAPYSITFFITPLPASLQKNNQDRIEKMAAQPGKLAKNRLKRQLNPHGLNSGIYVTHLGQFARSSLHGQVTLPRKTAETVLHVLITEDIKPLFLNPLHSTTVAAFVLDPKARSAYYKYQLIHNQQTGTLTWDVTEQQLPKDRIPADTLVIFSDPKNMVVPLGPTVTSSSDNFILPDIYITNTATTTVDALRFLKIRKFFHPVTFKYNYLPQGYQERVL